MMLDEMQVHNMLTEVTLLQNAVKELMEKYPSVIAVRDVHVQMRYKPYGEFDAEDVCFKDIFGEGEVKERMDGYLRHEAVSMGVKFIALEEKQMKEGPKNAE